MKMKRRINPELIDKRLIKEQLEKRTHLFKEVNVLSGAFTHQANFINDGAKLKAAWCTRRSAKSYTGGLYLIKECLESPGVSCLFVALTRLSAKGIIWKDILKELDRKHSLNIAFNETELTATFPNGSIIYVTGIDSSEDEMNKLLGKKYKCIILDEGSLYTVNLRTLIYGILKPAVADYRGTICLMGTSSNVTKGLFYDITTGKEEGWSLHQWTAFDNPYIAKQWQEEIDDIKRTRPLFQDTALFKQWYLNEWVIDETRLVYKFDKRNNIFNMAMVSNKRWSYMLGVDLGYHPDPSAFVLCGFSKFDKTLYILETFKKLEMDITDVANKIKEYQGRFEIYRVVIDNANKQAVEEMQRRHGIGLTAADKIGKTDFIEIMNAEFIQRRILLHETCVDLMDEYSALVWEEKNGEIRIPRVEHPNLPNHCTDAALYAWRFCYQYLSQPEPQLNLIDNREKWVQHSKKLLEEDLERQEHHWKNTQDGNDFLNILEMGFEENPLEYYLNKKKGRI